MKVLNTNAVGYLVFYYNNNTYTMSFGVGRFANKIFGFGCPDFDEINYFANREMPNTILQSGLDYAKATFLTNDMRIKSDVIINEFK